MCYVRPNWYVGILKLMLAFKPEVGPRHGGGWSVRLNSLAGAWKADLGPRRKCDG